MCTTLHTTDPAVAALAAAAPLLVDVAPGGRRRPRPGRRRASATPGRRSRRRTCARRCARRSASRWRSRAAPPSAAGGAGAARRRRDPLHPNHDLGGVGPMSGAVTASMPVLVARDEATGLTAWCPLNEGSGKVLRYGADGDGGRRSGCEWMRDVLGPRWPRRSTQHGPLDLHRAAARRRWSSATSATTAPRRARALIARRARARGCPRTSTPSSAATASSSSTSRWCRPSSRPSARPACRARRS